MVSVKLPRFVQIKVLKHGPAYYWVPPMRLLRTEGFPLTPEALGSNLSEAIARAEWLNTYIDQWRAGDAALIAPDSVEALVKHYRTTTRYAKLAESSRASYEQFLKTALNFTLSYGTRFGSVKAKAIRARHADALYAAIRDKDSGGHLSLAKDVVKVLRVVWSVGIRHEKVKENPWRGMNVETPKGHRVPAGRDQVEIFIAQADKMGLASYGTASLIAFELSQRASVVLRLSWIDSYDGRRMTIRHQKTGELVWHDLIEGDGRELHPGLKARIDATPKRGTLMLMRDDPDPKTGVYLPHQPRPFAKTFRKIANAAGLPATFQFGAHRHGGLTEGGDAGGTEAELMAASGHRSPKTLRGYVKPTAKQAASVARKRRDLRTKEA